MAVSISTVKQKTFINIGGCRIFTGEGAEGLSCAFRTFRNLLEKGIVHAFREV